MFKDGEYARMVEEAVFASFEVLSQISPGQDKTSEKPQ
jgi:hypothetical protein